MARTKILVDSGFLAVLYDPQHEKHEAARKLVQRTDADFIVPYVVLTEAAFLFKRTGGVPALARFLETLVITNPPFEPVTYDDLKRAREILLNYATAKLDFVDCCIMAIAERLNITQVCTFDHRDFSIFRPRHCPHLELLPG